MRIELQARKDGEVGHALGACIYDADGNLSGILSAYYKGGSHREAVRQAVKDSLALHGEVSGEVRVYGSIKVLRWQAFQQQLEAQLKVKYPELSLKTRAACNISQDCFALSQDALERKETVSERFEKL